MSIKKSRNPQYSKGHLGWGRHEVTIMEVEPNFTALCSPHNPEKRNIIKFHVFGEKYDNFQALTTCKYFFLFSSLPVVFKSNLIIESYILVGRIRPKGASNSTRPLFTIKLHISSINRFSQKSLFLKILVNLAKFRPFFVKNWRFHSMKMHWYA